MVDTVSSTLRSAIMSRVRSKNTRPEMLVRRMLHKAGYRYRLHVADLPGRPDLVFPGRRKVIFIHGCFWHLHDCGNTRIPNSHVAFWSKKLQGNKERDERSLTRLRQLGWDVLTVWECEIGDDALLHEIRRFLG